MRFVIRMSCIKSVFLSSLATLVRIQGAGHFVPSDRPGPALQMLSAFLDDVSYDTPIAVNLAPLKDNFATEEDVNNKLVVLNAAMIFRSANVTVDFRSQQQPRRS